MRRERIEGVCIGFVCSWELAAYASRGRVPTVTSTMGRLPRWARAALIVSVWWWTVRHFELTGQSPI